jgi:hypothetical protein
MFSSQLQKRGDDNEAAFFYALFVPIIDLLVNLLLHINGILLLKPILGALNEQ